jgi:hypothetical protein
VAKNLRVPQCSSEMTKASRLALAGTGSSLPARCRLRSHPASALATNGRLLGPRRSKLDSSRPVHRSLPLRPHRCMPDLRTLRRANSTSACRIIHASSGLARLLYSGSDSRERAPAIVARQAHCGDSPARPRYRAIQRIPEPGIVRHLTFIGCETRSGRQRPERSPQR